MAYTSAGVANASKRRMSGDSETMMGLLALTCFPRLLLAVLVAAAASDAERFVGIC